jgi:hypothetical protein
MMRQSCDYSASSVSDKQKCKRTAVGVKNIVDDRQRAFPRSGASFAREISA